MARTQRGAVRRWKLARPAGQARSCTNRDRRQEREHVVSKANHTLTSLTPYLFPIRRIIILRDNARIRP